MAAWKHPRHGFHKLFLPVRRLGRGWNHKRVYRVRCELKPNLRRKGKKRLPSRNPEKPAVPGTANVRWSLDFMSGAIMNGQRFRTFNALDDFIREALAIEVDASLSAARTVRVLERVTAWRGIPAKRGMDNGPGLVSTALSEWAGKRGLELERIQPGKPTQNSFIGRFIRTFRHESLGEPTPSEFLAINSPEVSTFDWS